MNQYLNPYNGGFGVYTARVMLGIDPEDYNVAYRMSDKHFEMTGTVKVYPNPANHLVTLEISGEIEQVDGYVEFFGIYGQMLNRCAVGKHSSDIDVSGFPPGVLYYRVINRGKLIGSGKLLIVK